ncbi:MAG: glycosyltransferase family 2 protein [Ignavibacteriales bacterium]
MKNPLVSVIINNYNYERFLARTIESVLAQTYPRVELIVVDDGSTDGSRGIIRNYAGRLTPIFKENGGQGTAINTGYEASKGELVLFLDSDDCLIPNTVQTVVDTYNADGGQGLAKIQFTLEMVDAELRSLGKLIPPTLPATQEEVLEELLTTWGYRTPPTSGNVYTREMLEKVMPVPPSYYDYSTDAYLNIQAPFQGRVLSIEEILGKYVYHGDNQWLTLGSELTPDKIRSYVEVDERNRQLLRSTAEKFGYTLKAKDNHYSMRSVMMLFKLEGPSELVGSNAFRIMLRGIRAAWSDKNVSLPKRILSSLWFIIVGLVPRSFGRLIKFIIFQSYNLKRNLNM